ncbi:MAG: DUF2059 domain-containing protein [Alphaproteobacteria bacterium]|nr:DUF2059 domain-containing protein [Alphaproteobacteria bacterium]
MTFVKACRIVILSTAIGIVSTLAVAQDSPANRAAAADRYLKAVPMTKMIGDSIRALSRQVPAKNRARFAAEMKKVIRLSVLEDLTRKSMVKTFSTDELNALADFYGSKHGSSAMGKFGAYMGQVMPALQKEIQRGIREIQKAR